MADDGGQKKAKPPGKVTFGGGEFWKPKVAETPRREARRLFLECVAEVEPHVLSDLRDHVLAPSRVLWKRNGVESGCS